MSTQFDVVLDWPYIGQTEYSSDLVTVLQIDDNVTDRTLRAYVQLGTNPIFKYWVPVMSGDDYTVDWTNADITAAIQTFFAQPQT